MKLETAELEKLLKDNSMTKERLCNGASCLFFNGFSYALAIKRNALIVRDNITMKKAANFIKEIKYRMKFGFNTEKDFYC